MINTIYSHKECAYFSNYGITETFGLAQAWSYLVDTSGHDVP